MAIEREENKVEGRERSLSRKELVAGLGAALAVFGFIAAATLGSGIPIVRMILIGPYGISAALWFFAAASLLVWAMRRERKRAQL